MGLRRFQNFAVGALTAQRLNELVDAVSRLQARVDQPQRIPEMPRGPMLVRIDRPYGQSVIGEPATGEGTEVIPATSYLFEQVFVRLNRGSGTMEIAARDYGIRSRAREGQDESLTLVAIDPRPNSNIPRGSLATIYPLDIDSGPSGGSMPDQQGLYMILRAFNPPVVSVYKITGQGATTGHYFGLPIPGAGFDTDYEQEPVEIVNLYETSDYYGALIGTQNPCAQLVPRTLGIGDTVPIIVFNDTYYTMTPVAFDSTCVPCNATPGMAAATSASFHAERLVAGIMIRG